MNKTLEILEELGKEVNRTFDKNGRLIINGNICLSNIKEVDKDFLKDTTINGDLYLRSLEKVDKDFLKDTTINGRLFFNSLRTVDKDFLKNTTINGGLYLDSLKSCDKDFLKNTTINGGLYLVSLKSVDKDFLKNTTINGFLSLNSLESCDKDFLKDTVFNGYLSLDSLKSCDKDFLKNTTINGFLSLDSLESVHKDFLKDTVINGFLSLSSLKSCDKDFLKDTIINGGLYLNSLKLCDKDFLKNTTINGRVFINWDFQSADKKIIRENHKSLKQGYNKEKSYCYFDGILSKVINVSEKQGCIIYKTPFDYVVQKGEFIAHAKTVKQGIIDVRFKEYAVGLKHNKLKMDDEVSSDLYRAITGACYQGMKQWMQNNGIEYIVEDDTVKNKNKLTVRDVYGILEKTRAYGFEKFKKLIDFN